MRSRWTLNHDEAVIFLQQVFRGEEFRKEVRDPVEKLETHLQEILDSTARRRLFANRHAASAQSPCKYPRAGTAERQRRLPLYQWTTPNSSAIREKLREKLRALRG